MPSEGSVPFTVFVESALGSQLNPSSKSRSQINKYTRLASEASRRRKKAVTSPASLLVGWTSQNPQSLQDALDAEAEFHYRPSLRPVIDSLSCANVHFDESAHRILQYFLSVTMPSKISSGVNNIAGFTPLLPGDRDIAEDQIRQALQGDTDLHFNTLLASNAGRMQAMSSFTDFPGRQPPTYALQAVRTLQTVLREGRISQILVLDVCLLSLWEYHAAGNVFCTALWPMMKDLAALCGGLAQCDAYVAYKTMNFDFLFGILHLKAPFYDFETSPYLLKSGLREVDEAVLAGLNPRVEVMYRNLTLYLRLWRFCLHICPSVLHEARQTILRHRTQVSRYHARPLISLSSTMLHEDRAARADLLYHEMKATGILIWVWHVIWQRPMLPDLFLMEMLTLHKQKLVVAERYLAGTNWQIPEDVLLWNLCVSQMSSCQEAPGIKARLMDLLQANKCVDQSKLENMLSHMLPLSMIGGRTEQSRIFDNHCIDLTNIAPYECSAD